MIAANFDDAWLALPRGRRVYPLQADGSLAIEDIARALGNRARFAGHTDTLYSVAQHCVELSTYFGRRVDQRWALLHDAAEAYLMDVPAPIRDAVYLFIPIDDTHALVSYRDEERRILEILAECYDLPWPMPRDVEIADKRIVLDEATALGLDVSDWKSAAQYPPLGRPPATIWTPPEAAARFLARYHELWPEN